MNIVSFLLNKVCIGIVKLLTLVGNSQELLNQLDLTGSLDVRADFDSDYSVAGEQVTKSPNSQTNICGNGNKGTGQKQASKLSYLETNTQWPFH